MKRTKEKRGITLIALIITIIVLLILAGVTISMVVGDNGVLKQAQNAKIKTEKAKDEELRGLTAAEAGGNLELTWYQDGENKVPIPAGFAVSQVEGENKIDDGLVIIDSNGNEFVWIPCGTKTGETYNTKEYDAAKDYVKNKWSEQSSNYTDKNWTNPNETIVKNSILKYGGFYIARFEAGVPSNAPFHISKTSGKYVGIDGENEVSIIESGVNARGANSTEETNTIKDLKPVSKRGVQVWNFISQTNAVTLSENMYKDNNTVDSCLISSNDWNYICENIFQNKVKITITNSKEYGNYLDNTQIDYTSLDCIWAKHEKNSTWKYATNYGKGSITADVIDGRDSGNVIELATGASDNFKVYNIYDMAGNVWEWMEEIAINGDVTNYGTRGGGFSFNGSVRPVVRAHGDGNNMTNEVDIGFRPVLYVK